MAWIGMLLTVAKIILIRNFIVVYFKTLLLIETI